MVSASVVLLWSAANHVAFASPFVLSALGRSDKPFAYHVLVSVSLVLCNGLLYYIKASANHAMLRICCLIEETSDKHRRCLPNHLSGKSPAE